MELFIHSFFATKFMEALKMAKDESNLFLFIFMHRKMLLLISFAIKFFDQQTASHRVSWCKHCVLGCSCKKRQRFCDSLVIKSIHYSFYDVIFFLSWWADRPLKKVGMYISLGRASGGRAGAHAGAGTTRTQSLLTFPEICSHPCANSHHLWKVLTGPGY